VKVFNALVVSNSSSSASSCFRKHELVKRRKYEQQVLKVKGGTFTLFIMSTSGGIGPSAAVTVKRLASLIADKQGTSYSVVLNVIRCCFSFSLVDSAIMCIRGGRTSFKNPAKGADCPVLVAGAMA
jgi:hypothetical protein